MEKHKRQQTLGQEIHRAMARDALGKQSKRGAKASASSSACALEARLALHELEYYGRAGNGTEKTPKLLTHRYSNAETHTGTPIHSRPLTELTTVKLIISPDSEE